MNKTSIEWTEFTANPIRARNHETGKAGHFCEKVSPGCAHCYASEWNEKRYGTGAAFLPANRERVDMYLEEKVLTDILKYKGPPAKLFLCDMTDLFAEWVPDDWLDRIFATMALQPRLTFQVLTKRPERMREYVCRFGRKGCVEAAAADVVWQPWGFSWPLPNVWLGVSVENQHWTSRLHVLKTIPAAVTFASLEPLLGPIIIPPEAMPGWVIAGGESAGPPKRALVERCTDAKFAPCPEWCAGGCAGTGWRPKPEALAWVRSLRAQCVAAGVPFFFKNWGGPRPKSGGRLLDGRTWDEFPEAPA